MFPSTAHWTEIGMVGASIVGIVASVWRIRYVLRNRQILISHEKNGFLRAIVLAHLYNEQTHLAIFAMFAVSGVLMMFLTPPPQALSWALWYQRVAVLIAVILLAGSSIMAEIHDRYSIRLTVMNRVLDKIKRTIWRA